MGIVGDEPWGYQIDDGRRWYFFMIVDDAGVKMVGRRDGKSRYQHADSGRQYIDKWWERRRGFLERIPSSVAIANVVGGRQIGLATMGDMQSSK